MQSALDIAFERGAIERAETITCLRLRVGALSGVVPDALQFAFEVLKTGTAAEFATLEVEFVPLSLYCPDCAREFSTDGFGYMCPVCERFDTEIRKGRELEITGVEYCAEGVFHERVC
jgi:hydrogenase nickel incorporation protein HypA/HybF